MEVKLIAITKPRLPQAPTPEQFLEYCGRVCWRTDLEPGSVERFIRALVKRGHLSVIEHASATFEISGVSRSCSHQLVRHRLASYSQESMRYVSMTNQSVVVPASIIQNKEAKRLFDESVEHTQEAYVKLCSLGILKQDARFILPIGTVTRLTMTQNFRSWRHFCILRCRKHAQWEIREVAKTILGLLYAEAPVVFEDLHHFMAWET